MVQDLESLRLILIFEFSNFFFPISDADQPGPFSTVEYSVADGPFSDYVAFENPLEGNVVLTKSLDYETMRSFSLTIEAKDQG